MLEPVCVREDSFFVAGVLHGSPKVALQGFVYAAITFTIQVVILRIFAIGQWAYSVQNSDKTVKSSQHT